MRGLGGGEELARARAFTQAIWRKLRGEPGQYYYTTHHSARYLIHDGNWARGAVCSTATTTIK